ncbi:hypothetical protein B0H14DRAFT_3769125 [Mycena olivaceomarginata]|nr:hypothetical protein B0H14DRAFT_3769125 [Mycena olivaceomarginata]
MTSLQEFWEGDDIGLAIIHERACEFVSSRASVEVRGAKSSVKSQGTGPGNNWIYGKGVFRSLKPNGEVVTHAQTTSTKSKTGSSDSAASALPKGAARNASGNHPSAPVDGPCACAALAVDLRVLRDDAVGAIEPVAARKQAPPLRRLHRRRGHAVARTAMERDHAIVRTAMENGNAGGGARLGPQFSPLGSLRLDCGCRQMSALPMHQARRQPCPPHWLVFVCKERLTEIKVARSEVLMLNALRG